PFRTLDVSFDLGLLSFENSYKEGSRKDHKTAENIMKSDNSPTLQFLVRPIMDLSIGTLIVPINLVLADTSSTGTRRHDMDGDGIYTNKLIPDVHDDFKLEDKTTQLGVDMALHTRPTKELRVIYATGMSLTKRNIKSTIMSNLGNANTIKEESETTALTIPLGVSVEHQTLSWLLLRFGAHKIIYAQNKTDATDEQYTGNVLSHSLTDTKDASRNINNELQITLGLGMRPMDKLDVDFALTAAVNATYSFDSIVSRLSLKYHY
ncbi:MAG: hypothetical protein JW827_05295, partial [Spirochaetes bacterium]|nr:hypothetical protein [Spirochaetota bacterium]